jgi:hypothetical protein
MTAFVSNQLTELLPITSSSVTAAISGVTAAPTITTDAEYVRYSVLGGDVMVTTDGSTPSASNGLLIFAGSQATLRRATYAASKFYPVTGTPTLYAEGYTL